MDIDISNPPEFEETPVDAYQGTVLPDEDDFVLEPFDIGVLEQEIKQDVPIPKPRATPKPRVKRQEVLPQTEMMKPMVVIPDSLMDTVIGRLASTVAECLEFPEASVFMALLSTASSSVATCYAVQYKTRKSVALGLYTVVEQPPATKKSYLLDVGLVPYSEAITVHNNKVRGKMREAVERKMNPDDGPRIGFNYTTDPTSAAMDGYLSKCSEGRFVVASSEQSAFMSLFPEGSYSSNNELLLKGWAGEYVAGMRAGRGAYEGTAQGSITLIAQPGSAKRVFAASNGSGLAERFIFMSEPDFLGVRKHEGRYPTKEDEADYTKAVLACVDTYSKKILSFANSDLDTRIIYDPQNLIQLRASNVAYKEILNKALINEPRMGELKDSGDMIMLSWLGKFETFTLKIAGVMHVIECLGNGCKVPDIIPDSLVFSAMELVDVLSDHIEQLIRDSGESGSDAEESAIIAALDKPLVLRAVRDRLRGRKPFRSMPGNGYKAITRRIEIMLKQGALIIGTDGKLQVA